MPSGSFVPGGTAARDWHRLSNAEGRIDTGHSLRAGLAELMRQTRHTSTEVALGYLCPICGAAMWPSGCFARVRWRKELLDFWTLKTQACRSSVKASEFPGPTETLKREPSLVLRRAAVRKHKTPEF
jgi:hypothetical protein